VVVVAERRRAVAIGNVWSDVAGASTRSGAKISALDKFCWNWQTRHSLARPDRRGADGVLLLLTAPVPLSELAAAGRLLETTPW